MNKSEIMKINEQQVKINENNWKNTGKKQNMFFFFISWIARQWDILHLVFNWENCSWDQTIVFFYFFNMFFVFVFSCFLLCFIFFLFFDQKMQKLKKLRTHVFSRKRKSQTCCKGVSGAMYCGKIWDCLRVAIVVKTKSVLIGHSLNRLNRMK